MPAEQVGGPEYSNITKKDTEFSILKKFTY
jgi:hypothetical protein